MPSAISPFGVADDASYDNSSHTDLAMLKPVRPNRCGCEPASTTIANSLPSVRVKRIRLAPIFSIFTFSSFKFVDDCIVCTTLVRDSFANEKLTPAMLKVIVIPAISPITSLVITFSVAPVCLCKEMIPNPA